MIPNITKAFDWNGQIPLFQKVQQNFIRPRLSDIPAAVRQAVDGIIPAATDLNAKRVAITAGSRGISEMSAILAVLVARLKELGAQPFIVPAMGSHGGATAEGQQALLADLGVTEESAGAPICASMETVELGRLDNGMPVYCDQLAAAADGIVIVNRIKPHTDFNGEFESGLAKMAAIGLGKLRGADTIHRFGWQGLRDLVPQAARLVCQKAPVLFGLAVLENAHHQSAQIAALAPHDIAGAREAELLRIAYQWMPRLPFHAIDVLVVEEMGKNISGVGMDTKVIGRIKVHGVPDQAACAIAAIAVLRLTPASHGNAAGIGLADVTTRRLLEQIDFETTYLNCITSGITAIQRAALPVVAPNEKAAIETALRVCGRPDPSQARLARIKNTLSLDEMDISPGLLAEALPGSTLTPIGAPFALQFDAQGSLVAND